MRGFKISTMRSNILFINSNTSTSTIASVRSAFSARRMSKIIIKIITVTARKSWTRKLCSSLHTRMIPRVAYLKLLSNLRISTIAFTKFPFSLKYLVANKTYILHLSLFHDQIPKDEACHEQS